MFVVSEWPVLRGPALGADPGQPSGFLEGVGASSDSSSLCGSSSTSPSPFELEFYKRMESSDGFFFRV